MAVNPVVHSSHVWALLMAAGPGRRFGGQKLLAPTGDRPLVAYAANAIVAARDAGWLAGGVAVTPPGEAELSELLSTQGFRVVQNPEPAAGLAHSLWLGLVGLSAPDVRPPPGAALVFLADQPLVRLDVVAALVAAWREDVTDDAGGGARVVRPRYAGSPLTPGHPVLVDRALWCLAQDIEGDVGLGAVLAGRPELVRLVDVGGENPDVDTLADLDAVRGALLLRAKASTV